MDVFHVNYIQIYYCYLLYWLYNIIFIMGNGKVI